MIEKTKSIIFYSTKESFLNEFSRKFTYINFINDGNNDTLRQCSGVEYRDNALTNVLGLDHKK